MVFILEQAERCLENEANRLVELVYDENYVLCCKDVQVISKMMKKNYLKYKDYIYVKITNKCLLKHDGYNWNNSELNVSKLIKQHEQYINSKRIKEKLEYEQLAEVFASSMIKDYDNYKSCSLFEIIPKLYKDNTTFKSNTNDYLAMFYLLEFALFKLGYKITCVDKLEIKSIN